MTSATAVANARRVQKGLSILTTYLQLTSFMFPPLPKVTDQISADYIIVGGGSAGSVIANRLSEDPNKTVLLVEAGGIPPIASVLPGLTPYLKSSRYDWNFTDQNANYDFLNKDLPTVLQGKMLGGSSSNNYMEYVRGAASDYDAWAELLDDDFWKYSNLLKFFKKSENLYDIHNLSSENQQYHGTDGYMGVTKLNRNETHVFFKAVTEMGMEVLEDVNGETSIGYTQPMVTLADGVRQSTAYSFLSKIGDRPNLIIYTDTQVTKVLFDDNNNAVGVEAVNDGRTLNFNANVEVILSAGPFNSPKILLSSGVGPKEDLTDMQIDCISDLPVGIGLQDHPSVLVVVNVENTEYPQGPINVHEYPVPVIFGSVALDSNANTPDYATFNYLTSSEIFEQYCALSLAYKSEVCDQLYIEGAKNSIIMGIVTLLHPKSRGNVTLNSVDPFDSPVIKLGRFSESEDLHNFVKYIEHYVSALDTNTFKELGGKLMYLDLPDCDAEPGSTSYWECYVSGMATTSQEFAGTCAMGSVVDSKLLVKGVNKLRVVDASVIPIITSGTRSVPAILIGEAAADIIKGFVEPSAENENHEIGHNTDRRKREINIRSILNTVLQPSVGSLNVSGNLIAQLIYYYAKEVVQVPDIEIKEALEKIVADMRAKVYEILSQIINGTGEEAGHQITKRQTSVVDTLIQQLVLNIVNSILSPVLFGTLIPQLIVSLVLGFLNVDNNNTVIGAIQSLVSELFSRINSGLGALISIGTSLIPS